MQDSLKTCMGMCGQLRETFILVRLDEMQGLKILVYDFD